jgi:hypothetical protein
MGTNKTVIISGLTIEGADAPNYSLTQPTTTASILSGTTGVGLQVVAVAAPSAAGATGLPPSLAAVPLGSTYYIEVWGQDQSVPGLGVSGGWVDVNYTTAVADALAVINQDFDVENLAGGVIDDPNGAVRDLGGGTLDGGAGVAPQWVRLAYVEFVAAELGEASFQLTPGSLPFALFDQGNVSWDAVDLGTPIMVDQIGGTRIDMTIVGTPSTISGSGEVAALPDSAGWVHEWQSFWVEIWGSTPDSTLGVTEFTVDLQYFTDYLTAQEIEYGPAFAQNQTGTIHDAQGLVAGIGGRTTLSDVGDDAYVLLARVRFASADGDDVPVDQAAGNIGPYDMQLELANGQTRLVGVSEPTAPELGTAPETELWAVVYDIDDNNRIDFGDFSFFAAAFGRDAGPPSPQSPYVWWADFDKTGRIDFGDLSFFAPNFAVSRAQVQSGAKTLGFPPNFPAAWRPVAGGDEVQGEWFGDGGAEGEASGADGRMAASDGRQRSQDQPQGTGFGADEDAGTFRGSEKIGTVTFATADSRSFSPFPLGASPIFSQPLRLAGLPDVAAFGRPGALLGAAGRDSATDAMFAHLGSERQERNERWTAPGLADGAADRWPSSVLSGSSGLANAGNRWRTSCRCWPSTCRTAWRTTRWRRTTPCFRSSADKRQTSTGECRQAGCTGGFRELESVDSGESKWCGPMRWLAMAGCFVLIRPCLRVFGRTVHAPCVHLRLTRSRRRLGGIRVKCGLPSDAVGRRRLRLAVKRSWLRAAARLGRFLTWPRNFTHPISQRVPKAWQKPAHAVGRGRGGRIADRGIAVCWRNRWRTGGCWRFRCRGWGSFRPMPWLSRRRMPKRS